MLHITATFSRPRRLAARKLGCRNSERSSSGVDTRRSTTMKIAKAVAAIPRTPHTLGDVHPYLLAWATPRTPADKATAEVATPAISVRGFRDDTEDAGSVMTAVISSATPTGTLMKKTD